MSEGNRERVADIDETPVESLAKPGHASRRWAIAVLRVVDSPTDPRTLNAWSRLLAASPSVLRAWCTLAQVPGKASLDFARLLRLVVRNEVAAAEESLDIADPRTIRRLLGLGGMAVRTADRELPTIEDFLASQRLIQSHACLHALHVALREPAWDHQHRKSAARLADPAGHQSGFLSTCRPRAVDRHSA